VISLEVIQQQLLATGQPDWADDLPAQVKLLETRLENRRVAEWHTILDKLKHFNTDSVDLDKNTIAFNANTPLNQTEQEHLHELLMGLKPWRKGPFDFLGIHVDTEWRSDWKWQRVEQANIDLRGRRVLDVGCGNGYHCLRMLGAGAKSVIGIDPTLLYVAQFLALNHFAKHDQVCILPFALEDLGATVEPFDNVFSMGVLYHRRSPLDHLLKLRELTREGGELILETLIITDGDLLVPSGRYAQMRNVWFIPSVEQLLTWLERCGFRQIEVIDISRTTLDEQRRTEWMSFDSLEQFLDPDDHNKTIEGYAAPVRAVIKAIT